MCAQTPQARAASRLPAVRPLASWCRPSKQSASDASHAPSARRPLSTEAAAAPEAPDYLSEGELKIFNMIKEGLNPVRLEVLARTTTSTALAMIGGSLVRLAYVKVKLTSV